MPDILIENHGSWKEDVYPLLVWTVCRPEARKAITVFLTARVFIGPSTWLFFIIDVIFCLLPSAAHFQENISIVS